LNLFGSIIKNSNGSKLRLVVFLGSCFLIGLFSASYFEKKQVAENRQRISQEIQKSLSEIARDVKQSLEIYSLELKSLRSFIYSIGFDELTYERFQKYSSENDYEKNYPGSRGFGFIKFVDWKDERSFIDQAKKDRNKDFQIKFLSENPTSRFVIQYIEPEYKNQQAIGLDIGSEIHRRSAALEAAHQKDVTLTAPITLVQANHKAKHGFLFLYPVFSVNNSSSSVSLSSNSASSIYGWVYASLRIEEILSSIQQTKTALSLDIIDVASDEHILFFEGNRESKRSTLADVQESIDIKLFGRVWRISASPTIELVEGLLLTSSSGIFFKVLAFFIIVSLFVALVWYLLSHRLLELRQKNELAAVVENGIEGTIGLDERFCFTYWNEAARLLLGFDESALDKPFLKWLEVSYSADFLIDLFKQVSKGQSIKGLEVKLPTEDEAEKKYLHLNFQPIFQEGVFVGANVSMVDLSKLRSLQNQLEEKNQLLSMKLNRQDNELKTSTSLHESVLQGADFLIITTDLKGVVTSVNKKLEELLEYTRQEVFGHRLVTLFQQASLSKLRSEILLTYKDHTNDDFELLVYPLTQQSRIEGEFIFTHKNGADVELQLTISAIKNSEHEIFGYLFIAADLRLQKTLKFDLELVRSAIQSSQDIMLWLDQKGNVCNSNPAAYSFLSYSECELEKLNVIDLLSVEVGNTWSDFLAELHDNKTLCIETSLLTKHGKLIPSLVTLSRLIINGSVYVFLEAKDITARLARDRALEDALNLATHANLSKDQFLANMGHELRTPLNEVNGSLQLLQLTDLSPLQTDYLSQSKSAVRLLTQSIDDVLDGAEIIRNKLVLDLKDMDFLELLNSVGQALTITAEDRSIEVHFDIADDVPQLINSDSYRLYQLLMCLMTNAIKFTFDGDVILKCNLTKALAESYELSFQIIDTGIGIDETKQKEIFEIFSQVEMDANRGFRGLGLTISKSIIELMSGEISCQSEVGKGSTFTFNVFVGKVEINALESEEPKRAILNVLVVDDNEISLSVLSNLIDQLGWTVTTASSSSSAVDILQKSIKSDQAFDLALIDWNMPDRTGLDLVKDIRSQFSSDDMPILVMVTAYRRKMLSQVDNRDVEELLNAFIAKPVTKIMLLDLVAGVFGDRKGTLRSLKTVNLKLGGYRILLVEDNKTNQFIAKNLLESQGAEITLASEGEEAWQILNNQGDVFDIVLMDIQMPGWDGYRVTKEIRTDKRFDDLPILAMTANVLASDKKKCFEAGMNGHIGKPFELIQLIQGILRLAKKTDRALPQISNIESSLQLPEIADAEENPLVLESEILSIIKDKAELDVQDALHRFGGSEGIYVQSLNMFISDLLKYEGEIKNLDNNLLLETIKPILHTLKGTSGLLGFVELSALTLECEKQSLLLSGKSIDVEPIASLLKLMKSIRLLLESVFKSQGELQSKSGLKTSESIDSELIDSELIDSDLLLELKQELENSNMRAIDVFKELKPSISLYFHDLAKMLDLQISKLQFKEALGELEKLEKQLSEHRHG
jgi:PAS domain S-box-containing protein